MGKKDAGLGFEKFLMVITSLAFGAIVFGIIAFEPVTHTKQIQIAEGCSTHTEEVTETNLRLRSDYSIYIGFVAGLLFAFLNPFIAAFVVGICDMLKSWAYLGQHTTWDKSTKIVFGSLWPITFIASFITFIYLGIIHRLFDVD